MSCGWGLDRSRIGWRIGCGWALEKLRMACGRVAKASPRLRVNYNYHQNPETLSHRMLNAIEPGTDIPIHRHSDKDESFAILRGKVRSTTYNNDGSVIESVVLCQEEVVYGVDIPKGVWHKLESLESGGVEFECKEGPFVSALMILLLKPPLLLVVGLGL